MEEKDQPERYHFYGYEVERILRLIRHIKPEHYRHIAERLEWLKGVEVEK